MSGNNGRTVDAPQYISSAPELHNIGADYVPKSLAMGNVALALLPTTPVSFTTDPLLAWGRLFAYGLISYAAWKKFRTASYVALGSAGVCVMTSLSSTAWRNA